MRLEDAAGRKFIRDGVNLGRAILPGSVGPLGRKIVGTLAGAVPGLGDLVRVFDNLDEIGERMRAWAEERGLSFVGGSDPNFQSPRSRDPYDISKITAPRAKFAQSALLGKFASRANALGGSIASASERLAANRVDGTSGGVFGLPAPTFASARRFGGPVIAGRDYIIGENGPEKVRFPRNGFVKPNARDAGASNDNSDLLRALLSELQELNKRQSDNTTAIRRLEAAVLVLQNPAKEIGKTAKHIRMSERPAGQAA